MFVLDDMGCVAASDVASDISALLCFKVLLDLRCLGIIHNVPLKIGTGATIHGQKVTELVIRIRTILTYRHRDYMLSSRVVVWFH